MRKSRLEKIYSPVYDFLSSRFNDNVAKNYTKNEQSLLNDYVGYANNFVEKFASHYNEKNSLQINLIPVTDELMEIYDAWFTRSLKFLNELLIKNNFERVTTYIPDILEGVKKKNVYSLLAVLEDDSIRNEEDKHPLLRDVIVDTKSSLWFSNYFVTYLLEKNLEGLAQDIGYQVVVESLDKGNNFIEKFNALSLTKFWSYMLESDISLRENARIAWTRLFEPVRSFLEVRLANESIAHFEEEFSKSMKNLSNFAHLSYVKDKLAKYNVGGASLEDLRKGLKESNIDDDTKDGLFRIINDEYTALSGLCFNEISKMSRLIVDELTKEFEKWGDHQ